MDGEKKAAGTEEKPRPGNEAKEGLGKEFLDNIAAAVAATEETVEKKEESAPAEGQTPEGEENGSGKPDEASGEEGEDAKDDTSAGEEQPAVDEALLERAIRAGMTMRAANAFTDPAALEETVTLLESKGGDTKGGKKEEEAEDPLRGIPDLDPKEFDENIVSAFAAMKDLSRRLFATTQEQAKEIKELKARGDSQPTWIDAKIGALNGDLKTILGAKGARAKLDLFIGTVKQAAKLGNERLTNDQVFERALIGAFGKEIQTQRGLNAKNAAALRAQNARNKPSTMLPRGKVPEGARLTDEQREQNALAAVRKIAERAKGD